MFYILHILKIRLYVSFLASSQHSWISKNNLINYKKVHKSTDATVIRSDLLWIIYPKKDMDYIEFYGTFFNPKKIPTGG